TTALTVDVSFHTTVGGVILGYQNQPLGTLAGNWVPALYVGTDGLLYGEIYAGAAALRSGVRVNDGSSHRAELSYSGGVQTLKLDGTVVGTIAAQVQPKDLTFNQLGTGYTANWPGGNGGLDPFVGTLDQVTISNNNATVGSWSFPGAGG